MKWLDTVATVLDVLTANCTFCKIKIVVSFRENEQTWPPFLVLAKCFRLFALWNTTWHFFSLINPKAWAKMAGIVNKDYCRTTLKESHKMWARLLEGQQHHLNEMRCISNWGNVNQSTPRILFQLLFFSVFQSVLRITSRKSMYGTIMSGNTQAGSWNELLSRTSAMGWNGMPTVTLIQLVRLQIVRSTTSLQIVLSTTSLQIVLSTRVVNTATNLSFEISALLTTDSRARTTF